MRELVYYGERDPDVRRNVYDEVDDRVTMAVLRMRSREGSKLPPGVEAALIEETKEAKRIPASENGRVAVGLPPCIER